MSTSLHLVLGVGLLLGMQHATEPDHLAAVASLVSRERSFARGLRHGVAWGLGHTLTLLLVAGGVGLLGWVISPGLAGRFEQIVGVMLVVLGVHLVWRMRREHVHFHRHDHHDGTSHFHGHAHRAETAPQGHDHAHRLPLRTLLVGMVHGLAGSAALALLVSRELPTLGWGLVYVATFGLGSLLGMALLSGAVAIPLGMSAGRLGGVHRALNVVVACFSVGWGLRIIWSAG